MSAGPAPIPGVETVVGMPLGVDTPARPPRIPPVPGKFGNNPTPEPGGVPRSDAPEPGSVGTLLSMVGLLRDRSARQHAQSQDEGDADIDRQTFGPRTGSWRAHP